MRFKMTLDMETVSALMSLCVGNHRSSMGSSHKSVDDPFVVSSNKLYNQSSCRWLGTPIRRHCNWMAGGFATEYHSNESGNCIFASYPCYAYTFPKKTFMYRNNNASLINIYIFSSYSSTGRTIFITSLKRGSINSFIIHFKPRWKVW